MSEDYTGFRITSVSAFVCIDDDDQEGIIAMHTAAGPFPMIAADSVRLEQLKPVVRQIAETTGKKITLARFTQREDCETIGEDKT